MSIFLALASYLKRIIIFKRDDLTCLIVYLLSSSSLTHQSYTLPYFVGSGNFCLTLLLFRPYDFKQLFTQFLLSNIPLINGSWNPSLNITPVFLSLKSGSILYLSNSAQFICLTVVSLFLLISNYCLICSVYNFLLSASY